ncbi:MAG: hypothetical protein HY362_02470 [Candidatus Aenigmarchaeota archaeon]|nr:hypothetical protein [Candidatus Aenigmarchaeota archaeon]
MIFPDSGRRPTSWDQVRIFDDLVSSEDAEKTRAILSGAERRCPYLKMQGKWPYCGKGQVIEPDAPQLKPTPDNPIYNTHLGHEFMEIFCARDFEECLVYKGEKSHRADWLENLR